MNESFFIVPTPIGNLGDITLRAIETLKSVDYIACEDTRVTQKLLNHYNIKTKTFAYHKYNEAKMCSKILDLLTAGKKIALVSDAGTPLICDPGSILINELRKNNINITSLAGASALTVFLSQIPFGDEPFSFIGFMPRKESQVLKILSDFKNTNIVFYDSPNRILKTLQYIKNFNSNINIAFGRELTKIHEEVFVMNIADAIEYLSNNQIKGEIIAMVYKIINNDIPDIPIDIIKKLKAQNFSAKDIATIVHTIYGNNKNDILKTIYSVS
jgi:16S rRNA (cytidine1402-2'-O)-methyltransferase